MSLDRECRIVLYMTLAPLIGILTAIIYTDMTILIPLFLLLVPLAIMAWILWGLNRKPKVRLNPQVGTPEPKTPDEGQKRT